MLQWWAVAKCFSPSNWSSGEQTFPLTLKRCHVTAVGRFLHVCVRLTGVNIWALSLKLPMKTMMDMRWLTLSMRLNCIIKRSSSLRASRGFLSLSYCRRSFTSASVGKNRIKHSTKSTRIVRRSKLRKHKATETSSFLHCFTIFSYICWSCLE